MDYENSVLKFGDGVHGSIPDSGYRILCEYTTTNHDGYVDFVDSMKSVDPTIKIGPCMLPQTSWGQDTIDLILQRMDFYIIHWYRHEDPASTPDYYVRMTAPTNILNWIYNRRQFIDTWAGIYADSIEIAFTEWNWILWNGTFLVPKANVSLASGLFTADVLGKLITAADELKLEVANYFCAPGPYYGEYLSFIGVDYLRRPAFYAFKMFSDHFGERLVQREVNSDFYVVGEDTAFIVTAYASKAESGDTLYLIVVNKHDTLDYETTIEITGFEPGTTACVYTLNGDSVYATNEEDSMAVIIRDSVITDVSNSFTYTFPAHSVTGIEFTMKIECTKGDVNSDGEINVLDVVLTVNIILEIHDPTPQQFCAADFDSNDEINVLDVVQIVNKVLGDGTTATKTRLLPPWEGGQAEKLSFLR